MECTNYFGLMRMPSNFLLGQPSSPTTGIFPGQAPAMGVYTSVSIVGLSVRASMGCMSMQIPALNGCIL